MHHENSLLRWSQIWDAHKTGVQSQDFVLAVEILTAAITKTIDVTELGNTERVALGKKLDALMHTIRAAKSVRPDENNVRAYIGEFDLRQTLQEYICAAGVVAGVVFDVKDAAPDFLQVLADRGVPVPH